MIRFKAGTLTTTIVNIRKVRLSEQKAAKEAARAGGDELKRLIKQNISLRDHDQAALTALGHPYAKRHGGIRIHHSGTKSLLGPQNRVHSQSEAMLRSLKSSLFGSRAGLRYRVWLDTAIAPHVRYVVGSEPTSILIPRDVLWDTAQAPFVQAKMMRKITDKLGRAMRSQGTLRFTR